jgi:hypothetical protein
MVFDLSDNEIPITVGDKDYTLKEASGDAVCKYRNMMLNCMEGLVDGKPSKVRNIADCDPFLVSLCLFDEKDKHVSLSVVRDWPNRVQVALFEKVKEISDMQDEEKTIEQMELELTEAKRKEESAKNEQSTTQGG